MIKVLIFDLGNVLIHNHPEWTVRDCCKLNGMSYNKNKPVRENNPAFMSGKTSTAEFARYQINRFKLGINQKQFYKIFSDIFTLNRPMLRLLRKLKKDYKLVMLSNTERPDIKHLTRKFPQIFKQFDLLLYSYNLGCVKPGTKIYRKALRRANCKAKDAVFIDDRMENIRGARKVGMKAIHFKNYTDFKKRLNKILFSSSLD